MGVTAYHLPGVEPRTFAELTFGDAARPLRLRVPAATPELIAQAAACVTEARDARLAKLPVARIVDAVDAAIARWMDPAYDLRRAAEELLPAVTGYSRPMVAYGLPKLLEPLRRHGLMALLRAEGLDGPHPLRPLSGPERGLGERAGPRLTTIVLAGNIPAVAVESVVHALLVKSACLVKASSRDPLFPALFAQSLAEADPEVGSAVAALWWKGGSEGLDRAALGRAEAVIAYGGAGAIAGLRRLAPPAAAKRFVAYGPRISFAAVAREALRRDALADLSARAAWDVSLFDQQGCVSPHAIFVERGGEASPLEFAQALATAMADFERRLPRGHISVSDAARIQQTRGAWAMRQAARHGVALFESAGSTAWTVACDEAARELAPSCLNRVVTVAPVDDLAQVTDAVRGMGRYLQTCGLEAPEERTGALVTALSRLGVSRFCPIGRMQHPPADWRHDGRSNLLPLLGWE